MYYLTFKITELRILSLFVGPMVNKRIGTDEVKQGLACRLGELAAKALAGGLPLSPKLHTLNVSYNPMEPADALLLLEAMKSKKVKLVNLLMADVNVNKAFTAVSFASVN